MSPLRFRYQTFEIGTFDMHVRTLRDTQQFDDEGGAAERLGISSAIWPLFGVVWPSGRTLAELMADYPVDGLRVLEVGCGIGLASLVLHRRDADITATDHHPETAAFLDVNVELNGGGDLRFVRASWDAIAPELGTFDLIIGSDLLYESGQAELLASFVDSHARPQCTVLIVDPGRGMTTRFAKLMSARGYRHSRADAETAGLTVHSYVR